MSRRRVSNPLALAVLACLNERPMHPYEISTTLRNRGKEQSIKLNYGSLYAVVESLQKHGLITSRATTREGRRPERTVYEITEAGAERVRGLARRAAVHAGARVHLAGGRAVADGRAAAGRGGPAARRPCREAAHRAARTRAAEQVATRWGCPSCSSSRAATGTRLLTAEMAFVTDLAEAHSEPARSAGPTLWRRMHELRARRRELRGDLRRSGRLSRGGGRDPADPAARP